MIRRLPLYFLCFAVIILCRCKNPLEPGGGGDKPGTEIPTVPEEPILPPGPVDPDNPGNPDKPTDPDKPIDPDKPVDPDKPIDPDKPVDPDKPIDPDKPVDPDVPSYIPKVLFFENFEKAELPEGFKVYDQDKQVELFPKGGAWFMLGADGGGANSYCIFKDPLTGRQLANGANVPVDNWIVTKGVTVDRVHTRLSCDVVALGFNAPLDALDSFEVYISTVGQEVSDMQATEPVYSKSTIAQGGKEYIEVNLDKYIGQTIYVGFRHCTPVHNSTILRLFNIKVKEYYELDLSASRVNMRNVYRPNEEVSVSATIYNAGLSVRSATATYTYGSQKVTETFPVNLGYNQSTVVTFAQKLVVNMLGESKLISIEVAPDNNNSNNGSSTQAICLDKEPAKCVLAEKLTSASCSPCGGIINTLDEAEAKYPGKVIGVAIHTVFPAGDNMSCLSYLPWVFEFYKWTDNAVHSVPSCSMNKLDAVGYPTIPSKVMEYYDKMISPAALSIDASYDPHSRVITATANTTFVTDATCKGYFRIGFVITEDGLVNGQTGAGTNPETEKPYNIHNHTARELLGGTRGFENSLPDQVVRDATNKYTVKHTVPTQYDKDTTHPPKPENMSVVAILYHEVTGEVLNCARVRIIQ